MAQLRAGAQFRTLHLANTTAYDIILNDAPQLLALHQLLPELKIYTQSSENYDVVRHHFWSLQYPTSRPLAICRPSSVLEVSHIVSFCTSRGLPLAIRSGGLDPWARSCVNGAVVIDMREIDSIVLSPDKKFVKMGGGTLMGNLIKFLDTHGLIAAGSLADSVGYIPWATAGGYGPQAGCLGFGVDQIVGAVLVLANGEVVNADNEMLWGIRGAGTAFGIIVELTIKVHAIPKMLHGVIGYPISEVEQVLTRYRMSIESEYPDPYGGTFIIKHVQELGFVVMFLFTWTSNDLVAGREYADKLRKFGTVVVDSIEEAKLSAFLEFNSVMVMRSAYTKYCTLRSAVIGELTPEVISIFKSYTTKSFPSGVRMTILLHPCHGKSTLIDSNSSFLLRRPHFLVEITCRATSDVYAKQCRELSIRMADELKACKTALKWNYLGLSGPELSVQDSFGVNYQRLLELKKRVDRFNIFSASVPSLGW